MNTKIVKGASILSAMLMVSVLFSTVLAGPVQPFNRWGTAYDSGGAPLNGVEIYSWIDGVSYGMTTTDGTGLFSLDTYGDDTTPDAVKTGGYNGDTVFYSIGPLTNTGTFFAETDTWTVGGFNIVAADLNEVAASPALLKINNVASQSGFAIDDYVVVYNPSGGPVDVTLFSLDIGGAGAFPILAGMVCPDSVNPVPAGAWCALDLTGLLSTTGNSITLSETATGFIVDRVEYGAIPAEPENTMMPNAPNPPALQEIYRVPVMGADTNDCAVDFTPGPAVDHGGAVTTATATGPLGIGGGVIDMTYIYTLTPVSVDIFYSVDGNATWNFLVNDPTVDGSILGVDLDVLGSGPGLYNWIANANGGDDDVGIPAPGTLAEASPYIYSGMGVSPTDIAVHESGGDVLIDWTTGSGPFEVYRSMSFTGGFALYDTTAGMSYTDVGAYADGNNYAYVIRAQGDPANSNMGYKLVRPLASNGLANSWVGLPYKCDLLNVDMVMDDINADGPGGDTCDVFTYWDTAAQGFVSRTDIGAIRVGPIFPMNPGQGYQAHVTQPVTWKVVGADIDVGTSTTVDLVNNGLANTWITFPYNTLFANADQVMDQINADGPGGDSIDVFTYWDEAAQGFVSRTDIGAIRVGPIFAINPGFGYQTHMVNAIPGWNARQNLYYP